MAPPPLDTSSTVAARDHARAQGTRRAVFQPTVPAADAIGVVDASGAPVAPERLLWDDVIGPGGDTSRVLPRGAVLRLTDLEGDACAGLLVYNAAQPLERLNVADTVKVQWQAYLGARSLLLSDMGRVLLSIAADTSGAHDALCGASTRLRNEERYGSGGVHGERPNARDRFAVALAKHGLGRRDIVPNINFFKAVRVEPDGALRFVGDGSSRRRRRRAARRAPGDRRRRQHSPRARSASRLLGRSAARHRVDRPAHDARRPGVVCHPGGRARVPADRGVPVDRGTRAGSGMNGASVLHDEVVDARAPWAHVVDPGCTLRIVDLEGNQAVDCILYNADDPAERYSAPDTMVAQGNIFLVEGSQLLSNESRPMMTVTSTSCERHDTIGGACSRESNALRYGFHTRHEHACVDNFLLAHSWRGMGKRDMTSNINWFMNVPVEADGTLGIVDGISAAGLAVDLRAHMRVLVVISNCPQINNPCNGFDPTPIRLVITR